MGKHEIKRGFSHRSSDAGKFKHSIVALVKGLIDNLLMCQLNTRQCQQYELFRQKSTEKETIVTKTKLWLLH